MKALYGIVFALAVLGVLFADVITDFFDADLVEYAIYVLAASSLVLSMCYKLGWI